MIARSRCWARALVAALLCGACSATGRLDQHVDSIEQMVLDAEGAGAMHCAPRQLAVARSHLAFAQIEREQGFISKAERHLEIADEHARAARILSPAARCAARAARTD